MNGILSIIIIFSFITLLLFFGVLMFVSIALKSQHGDYIFILFFCFNNY